ncbi:Transmembrane protein [Quillaja saponaria]|uniref:Transmembrane protein n=1 Tax=Quillaja saponaria TaxID=32244 RepID=A0AAD7VHC4_QUISA|nr:Transmembrane protein [Quillaja saponaria]
MIQFLLSYKNLILHALLSLSLTLILTFFKIPTVFLQGVHTYIHPDTVGQGNGVKAAIRRPGSSNSGSGIEGYQNLSSKTGAELRKRNKSKEKVDFDENNAQIFRLKLDEGHLQSRLYIDEYRSAFTISFIALSCILLQNYLNVSKKSGFLANGVLVPVLLGGLGVGKLFMLLTKISFEKSASRRSEKQLSVLCGGLGLMLGLLICSEMASSVLDFNFGSIDGFGRSSITVIMGLLAGLLFMPATKFARSFWLGTDQLRCNLSMITCGWFTRMILHANNILNIFAVLLWINPLTEILVNTRDSNRQRTSWASNIEDSEKLVGNGLSRSDFIKFRLCCLLISSLLQIVTLRSNLQMYLNEALLCWYQRLHASKVPDLDFSRAKVFLHNHYLCLAALQFLAPPVLVLLFLGLSQIGGCSFENLPFITSLLPYSAFVKEVALFMAWWVAFVWAVLTSVILLLHRHGILYVS